MAARLKGRSLILTGTHAKQIKDLSDRTQIPPKWLLIAALVNYILTRHGGLAPKE